MKRLGVWCSVVLVAAFSVAWVQAVDFEIDDRRLPVVRTLPTYFGSQDGPVTMADNGDGLRLAVWSYVSGLEVDLAISQQAGRTWYPATILGQGNGLIDEDPDISFLPDGRPLVVWTQRDAAAGASDVVFSLLTAAGWTEPGLVSLPGTNGRSGHLVAAGARLFVVFSDDSGAIRMRGFVTEGAAAQGGEQGSSGSNGPDPMPNISVPPERDPGNLPSPRQIFRPTH